LTRLAPLVVALALLAPAAVAQREPTGPPPNHDGALPTPDFVDGSRALPLFALALLAGLLLALWGFVLWAGRRTKRR